MIAIPSLAGVHGQYKTGGADVVAATAALALLDAGQPEPAIRRTPGQVLEHATLGQMLRDWLTPRQARLQLVQLGIHLSTNGQADMDEGLSSGEGMYVHIGNVSDDCWDAMLVMQPRFDKIAHVHLYRSALIALSDAGRSGLSIFMPGQALAIAEYLYWNGWHDESELLKEHNENRDDPNEPEATAESLDIITRATFDSYLPPMITELYSRKLGRPLADAALLRIKRRGGEHGTIAAAILDLRALLRTTRRFARRSASRHVTMEYNDDNGYEAIGEALVLRWNEDDPMPRIFDDHGQECAQSSGYTEAFGWFHIGPTQLPAVLEQLDKRIDILAAAERLALLIAERSN